ncbi:MAG TPA: hypothetical protein PK156_48770, partial [Polyangium sp.]|nr:hypothetical protein [Polyangium sp.]
HSVPPDSPAVADLQPASALAALSASSRPKSIPAEPEAGPKAERYTLLELASRNPTTPPSSRTRQAERPSASLAQLAASLTEGPKTEPPGTPRFSTEPRFATISGQTPLTAKELVGREAVDTKRGTVPPAPASSRSTGFSFAELWPEADRAAVRDLETAIAVGRCSEAIDHADTLVSRILMNTATLFGSIDIARDATNMPHLLGIDGRRYLAFRSIVRASRSGAKASLQDALAAYAFAVEVRMARSLIR